MCVLIRILQQELLYPLPLFQRICHSLLSTHGSFKLSFLQLVLTYISFIEPDFV
jgi:hypothetical protein